MKAKTGKKAGFNRSLIGGMSQHEVGFVAHYGSAVTTNGAKLAKRYRAAVFNQHLMPEIPSHEVTRRKVADEIAAAVSGFKPMLLRQIADYLDAIRGRTRKTPADDVLLHAQNFIQVCRGPRPVPAPVARLAKDNFELFQAIKRASFTPSVTQIHGYLCSMIGDDVSRKTAARVAKKLGI